MDRSEPHDLSAIHYASGALGGYLGAIVGDIGELGCLLWPSQQRLVLAAVPLTVPTSTLGHYLH